MPSARPLIDHDEIRKWAEERRARPACVKGTGGKGDPGMIRLDFPGFSGKQSLAPISWEQWFRAFDENGLALMVQERTARGQSSNFNKLVSRKSTGEGGRGARSRSSGTKKAQSGRRQSARAGRSESNGSQGQARRSRKRTARGTRKPGASTARGSTAGGGRATAAERSGSRKGSRRANSSRNSSSRHPTRGRGRK